MATEEIEEGPGLPETPTYSVALTAFVFILVSLLVERGIHRLRKYLKRTHQKPLRKVLDTMTEELMLLGFISLLLTVLQNPLVKICVTKNFSEHMLPCSRKQYAEAAAPAVTQVANAGRRLLGYYITTEQADVGPKRQLMAEASTPVTGHCASKGQIPFVTLEGLHQLHLFIFVLAVTHVGYCVVTVTLGFARLHNWQKWEQETREDGYDGNLDLERRYCKKLACKKPPLLGLNGHANAFVDRHANHAFYEYRLSLWILCFFQQFFASVSREDYLIFRVGFLNKHILGESFNFRDYVIRSMEVDFKRVIGISWWLWLFVIAFLLLDVNGWFTYFWVAFIPTIIVLVIGTKQQHIISTLALQAKRHAAQVLAAESNDTAKISRSKKVIDISTAVSPSDNLFWFDNPRFLLKLIHFVIFQNSFEFAIFFWLVTSFGWKSCILGNHVLLIVRLIAGVLTQLLASYSTLPIYALVTQMGSQMKETVFTKDVYEGIQGWKQKALRRRGMRSAENSEDNSVTFEGSKSGRGATTDGSGHVQSNERLPSIPREGKIDEPLVGMCPILTKKCQLMYGKQGGLEKLRAASKIEPD